MRHVHDLPAVAPQDREEQEAHSECVCVCRAKKQGFEWLTVSSFLVVFDVIVAR